MTVIIYYIVCTNCAYLCDKQVPASEGEFESSMKDGAQTREHATLLKALVSLYSVVYS